MEKNIAILIPCFNERGTITKVISDFAAVLPKASIYVYDNNSSDGSDKLAIDAGAIVKYERLQGKGNVIRGMFRTIDADCYLLVDADDTYPAEFAPQLIDLVINHGADMVVGDRLSSTYFVENKRKFHNFGNVLVRFLINRIFNSQINDIMSGYRAFSKAFVKNFPISSAGFEIETEMTIHALDKRFSIREVPILYRDRPDGSESKLNTYKDGLKVVITIFDLFKDLKPFAFFGSLAIISFIVSVFFLVPIVVEYIKTDLVPRFPTLIAVGFLIVASLLLFFVGIILDTLKNNRNFFYELNLSTWYQENKQQ